MTASCWPRAKGRSEGQPIGIGGAANLVEPGANVDATFKVELGAGSQIVAQSGADVAGLSGSSHPGEIVSDEAVEEVVLDRAGISTSDDCAADPDSRDGQHPVYS